MEIICKKGERIILTDNCSQKFVGIVKSFNPDFGRVVLSDIVQLPEHKKISGYRNFDKSEIVELKKFEIDIPDSASLEQKQPQKSGLKLSESDFKKVKKLQSEYRYIEEFGTNFQSAISVLKTYKEIGVSAKDVSKGRFGTISVLAMSTPLNIFVFDVKALGHNVFTEGLKEILESLSILKIVYDCRWLSDCLKHKHSVQLENIRDVEAEDIMVVYQDRKIIRRHRRSLEYLMKVYLGLELVGLSQYDEASDVWNKRPLPPNLLEKLISFTAFLIPLHQAIERKYLQKLFDASKVYNDHVRSLDFFEILYDEPKKTLKKQISELVVPQNKTRNKTSSEP